MTTWTPLCTLAHVSTATRELSQGNLLTLSYGAQRFNQFTDITGLLIFDRGELVEVIEGTESHISDVFQRIKNDPLHGDIRVFVSEPIQTRFCPSWAMLSSLEQSLAPLIVVLQFALETAQPTSHSGKLKRRSVFCGGSVEGDAPVQFPQQVFDLDGLLNCATRAGRSLRAPKHIRRRRGQDYDLRQTQSGFTDNVDKGFPPVSPKLQVQNDGIEVCVAQLFKSARHGCRQSGCVSEDVQRFCCDGSEYRVVFDQKQNESAFHVERIAASAP